jgi:hypothetical protein
MPMWEKCYGGVSEGSSPSMTPVLSLDVNSSGVAGFGDPKGNGTGVFGNGVGPQSTG